MSCETVRERFYEHLFGLLDGEERVAVEAHLEACPECRKALEQAVREKDLLGAWKIELRRPVWRRRRRRPCSP